MQKKPKLTDKDIINQKNLGNLTISATGLRRIANAIQKQYKTNGDVKLKIFICTYPKLKTIGIILK